MDIQSPFFWLALAFVVFAAVFFCFSWKQRTRGAKTVSGRGEGS